MTDTRGKAAVAADPQTLLDAIRTQVCGSATPGAYPHTLIDQMWDTLTDVQRHGTGQLNGAPSGGPQGTPNGTAEDVLAQLTGSPTPGQITRWGPTTSKARAGWDGRYRTLAELVAQVAAHAATLTDSGPTAPKVTLTATPAGDGQVRLDWTATAAGTVTGWTASRDGTDTHDTGPWSTPELAAATDTFTMSSLVPGQSYQFTVTGHVTGGKNITGTAAATATGSAPTPAPTPSPTPTPTPTPAPSGSDGVTAAATHGWGPVQDGDEFDYTGPPRSDRWSMYDGPGNAGNGRRTPAAFSVGGGILTCHGDANCNTGGMSFRSGRGQRFYRVEARMALYNSDTAAAQLQADLTGSDRAWLDEHAPDWRAPRATSGAQYHPVLLQWPDDERWPQSGEDDWAETDIGSGQMSVFIHHPGNDPGAQSSVTKDLDLTQFHNYAVERTPDYVAGYIDGVQWFYFTDPAAVNLPGPMHGCVQLDATSPGAHQPANMDLAWYRVYSPPGS